MSETETETILADVESIRLLNRGVAKLLERGQDRIQILAALVSVMNNYLEFCLPEKSQEERVEFVLRLFRGIKMETVQ